MGDMNPIFDVYAMDEAKAKARAEGFAAGYEAGQRDIRERATREAVNWQAYGVVIEAIRALPINPPPAEAGKEKP